VTLSKSTIPTFVRNKELLGREDGMVIGTSGMPVETHWSVWSSIAKERLLEMRLHQPRPQDMVQQALQGIVHKSFKAQ